MIFAPSPLQQAIFSEVDHGTGSLIIEAVAGSGKTTTCIGCVARIPRNRSVLFLAFNKSIADELKERIPDHTTAMTLNSFGHRALMRSVGGRINIDSNKTRQLMRRILSDEDFGRFGEEIKKLV